MLFQIHHVKIDNGIWFSFEVSRDVFRKWIPFVEIMNKTKPLPNKYIDDSLTVMPLYFDSWVGVIFFRYRLSGDIKKVC